MESSEWGQIPFLNNNCAHLLAMSVLFNLYWNEQHYETNLFAIRLWILLSHAVAFMRFSQSAYSHDENNTSLSVSLVLDTFGGFGGGFAAISQDIVQQIIPFAQAGDNATGKRLVMECVER